ncbi:MAG: HEAT repeat domain-containing protein [Chlamydiales bacterium]
MGKILKYIFFITIFFCNYQTFADPASEPMLRQRIKLLFLVKDAKGALETSAKAIHQFPESLEIKKLHVQALSQSGYSSYALQLWEEIKNELSDPKEIAKMQECIAWGIISTGKSSSRVEIKNFSLFSSFLTQDARASKMLLDALNSSNAVQRALGIRLAAKYGNAELHRNIINLLATEKVAFVRKELIEAIGVGKIIEGKEALQSILSIDTEPFEKYTAIHSLSLLSENLQIEEITALLQHPQASFRLLAIHIIDKLNLQALYPLLFTILQDPSLDVKIAGLKSIGLHVPEWSIEEKNAVKACCLDTNPFVSMLGAWNCLLHGEDIGTNVFIEKMQCSNPSIRIFASALLSFTGFKGLPLIISTFQSTEDPYVRVNLARSLISLRVFVKEASLALLDFIRDTAAPIMWDKGQYIFFPMISPSNIAPTPLCYNLRSVMDGMTRLSLLNNLLITEPKVAVETARNYLHNHFWGLSANAAAMLMETGNTYCVDLVKNLLNDSNKKIRLQAALVLAFMHQDERAAKILEELYYTVRQEDRFYILEALGQLSTKQSIPFLMKLLAEPFTGIRIAAASILIQNLYH